MRNFLIHDAGYISNATRCQMVDLVGLKTLFSREINRKYTYATRGVGRSSVIDRIAHAAGPDYLATIEDWDGIFQVTAGLRILGWRPEEVSRTRGSASTDSLRHPNPSV